MCLFLLIKEDEPNNKGLNPNKEMVILAIRTCNLRLMLNSYAQTNLEERLNLCINHYD